MKNLVVHLKKKESSKNTRDEKLHIFNDESKKIREKIRDGAPPPPFPVTISHGRRKVNRRCVKHERARLLRRVPWWISRPGIKKGREEREEKEKRKKNGERWGHRIESNAGSREHSECVSCRSNALRKLYRFLVLLTIDNNVGQGT